MKNKLTIAMLFLTVSLYAQEKMDYIPPQKTQISDKDYRHAKMILENSYQQIKESKNPNEWVYADYWNVAVAYHRMGVSQDSVIGLMQKSYQVDPKSFCQLIAMKDIQSYWEQQLGQDFIAICQECSQVELKDEKESPKAYALKNGYDPELIIKLDSLMQLDQQYRGKQGYSKNPQWVHQQQNVIDPSNFALIKKIITEIGYPGVTKVGERYASTACLIIEHAGNHLVSEQEVLIPIIHQAVSAKELSPSIFRMLIDRVHWHKTGKQIFGSQQGIPFDADKVIEGFKTRYNL